jgi:hypothetical protein
MNRETPDFRLEESVVFLSYYTIISTLRLNIKLSEGAI